ncbi:aerobic-type carbon monoxide dehydrogenase, large subunit CoxL/CutL-like protein [Desulfocapsa sulfexigens DSM 10523]|uniref:Aerobic-type carbon monoxide dehydrogenase, large subunit CoxL/CutL-like protein n=1 Tax=Desulfocapsa sulfexigens (strain DSM 10523 / SB164P1) TaxID=1167006 RepID=M1PN57_DESSD|nr:xanthine dehydrogenase subunit XdhA [Desulfocapsa sulfexigens]AGF77876.1 aerobic-type carbon monoxide dehydrogenase, large subunit CoxL/CutL-like protein [Desulfocapsa sulfexigens DSM 10523]
MAVGQSHIRKDVRAKVTGKTRYTDDFSMPGMLHAKYVRSPIAHGLVKSIDTTAALAIPGVEAVFTHEDVPKILFATAGHPFSLDPDHQDVADRLLLTDHVRYHGDEVAIVVARDLLTAAQAAKAVIVEYEELPVCVTSEAAMAEDAPAIHPGGNSIKSTTFEIGGKLEDAEKEADLVVEDTFSTPIILHCHLENHVAYAYMDDNDHIVVVSSTQIPHICRRIVGQALDMPWPKIRVIKPYIGGGFGNKQDVVLEPMVAFLTRKLGGVPVKIELEREEGLVATRTRHGQTVTARAGVSNDGIIKFIDLNVISNTGAYASHGHSIPMAAGSKFCNLYPRSVSKFSATTHYGNIPAAGAMRAYGSPQLFFGVESVLEEVARKLGMDSVDFRIKNSARPADIISKTGNKEHSVGMVECLEKGREAIGWDVKKEVYARQEGNIRRGLGVASFSYGSGTYPACVEIAGCRLVLNQDGTVHMQIGATEIGQGSDTALAQMAAETLGVDYDAIHVVSEQDTDVSPFDPGAYASRQTYVAAPAVHRAAGKLKAQILEHYQLMTGEEAETLDLTGGKIIRRDQPESVLLDLHDLALDSYYHKERGGQLTAEVSSKTCTNAPSYGCTFVDLEVDIEMCTVTIRQIINVHDAGKIIHPLSAEGQVHGGMGMGVGMALFEELLVDPESGRIYNGNLLDYKIPTCVDIPDLQCAFVETFDPTSPYGNKSLGEPPIISQGPAIRNAIWDATGVKINEIPMTPKVLFKHFKNAGLI